MMPQPTGETNVHPTERRGADFIGAARLQAGQRFEALSRLSDPWTLRHVDALGFQPGWRCGEVGAGGPNVPRQLAARVGARGYVLATDLDPRRRLG